MNYLIPVISSILFRLGGYGRIPCFFLNAKWWRWGVLPYFIGGMYHNALAVLTYYLAVNVPYGDASEDDTWINKLYYRLINDNKQAKWAIYGTIFGLASIPILGVGLGLIQAIISGFSFWLLMYASNEGIPLLAKLDHKWVEIGIGFLGTIVYLWRG